MSVREPICEPCPIPSTFVDGLSAMRTIGAVTHLIFTARQVEASSEPGGSIDRIVQARLIVPTDQLQAIGKALLSGHVATIGTDESGEAAGLH